MSQPGGIPDLAKLDLDEDTENLFASPENDTKTQKRTPSVGLASADRQRQRSQSEVRETRLRTELERIREINRVVTGVTASLSKAKESMQMVDQTVNNASRLLSTWTRILSQTEHNQRLILNPNWHGATKDMENIENEELRRQQDAEQRAMEEQRRREEAQRHAEEEERRKAMVTPTSTRGTRGRGARHVSSSSRGHVGLSGQTQRGRGVPVGRASSNIGRGINSTRGRGRGLT